MRYYYVDMLTHKIPCVILIGQAFIYFLTKHGADHGCPERTVHICIKFNFDTKVAFAKSMTE